MEWKIENRVRNAKGQVLLQVHVPAAEFAKQLELAFTEALPELDLPGVDQKTVTRAQAEAVLGAQYFYPAAAQRCCQQALQEALEQLELETVGYPAFSSCGTDPTGLRFTAVLDLYPQATLGEYKDMRPQLDKPAITEEEVEQTLELFAARAAEVKTLDRPAALGDSVRLDLEGFADGRAFAGGKAEDYPLELGSHTFIPGLEEGIVGCEHLIPGFARADAVLSGVESRTSSPVRISRDERCQSPVQGIYPCGEGAGYAGGITSAAMDGIKVAEFICEKFRNLQS